MTTYHIKTNNPSTMIDLDELLTVRFPDLKENQVIIPGTTKLTFNISLSGKDANKTLVKNLVRNIVRKPVVKLEGNETINIDDIIYIIYLSFIHIMTVGKVQLRRVMLVAKRKTLLDTG